MNSFPTKSEAMEHARKVKKMLKNPRKWGIRCHNNFGWHWTLYCGNLTLSSHRHGGARSREETYIRFSCLLGSNEVPSGGLTIWTTRGKSFKDPNDAIRHQLKVAQSVVEELQEIVNRAKEAEA